MTETQRKIREYRAMLPGLKERVMAVAVLLVVSMTMVVSASFAWITLSRAPEVSMIATTVASNGNLEIALVDHDGEQPDEVAIGDSSSTPGNNLVTSNIKWGNLVNLSDNVYGLNQISLRPALLSGYNLNVAPLYGATYSADGRVQDVSATYQYASWKQAEDGRWYFAAGKDSTYGVRAISSVKFENITGNATISNMIIKARTAYTTTTNMYMDLINGVTMVDENRKISCMDALTMLLEIYVNETGESAMISGGYAYYDYQSVVTYTYRLLLEYQKILDAEGEALVTLANLQAYAKNGELGTAYFQNAAELRAASTATLNKLGIKLDSLNTYKTNYTDLVYGINGLTQYAIDYDPDTGTKTDKVYWPDRVPQLDANGNQMTDESGNKLFTTVDGIGKYVMKLVDISKTTANGYYMKDVSIMNASSVLKDPIKVVIKGGVLKDTEQRLGNMLNGTSVTINITVMSLGSRKANVYTDAAAPFLSNNDLGHSASLEASGQGDAISLDTYGLAIDLWTRTNAEDAILTLEGNTQFTEIDATGIDKNGDVTVLYVASSDAGVSDVYMLPGTDEKGNAVTLVYDAVSHTEMGIQSFMMTEEGGNYSFTRKKDKIVTGFNGENRVWEDWEQMIEEGLIDENSTTQGAGSCYVFYANPSDQTRILDMLKAFTIAFLDQSGNHIATAKLDTEHHYAINGKVTVPMVITSGVTYLDENDEEQMGIRVMPRNAATWLTAVVYLDGMQLTNEHVLAAGEIEGRLNFQFGTFTRLNARDDIALQQKFRTVSATAASGGSESIDAENPISFAYDGQEKAITVTLTIEGDQPTNVEAFFIRSIGASQGTRTDSEKFMIQSDGTWKATFKLTKPGDYSLRSVIMDGVEYVLESTPSVSISGLSITSIRCTPDSGQIMTANQFVDVDVEAVINADPSLMPKQVRALFRSTDTGSTKEYAAIMSYNAENEIWEGTARISASGTYQLLYLVMDGDYNELSETQQKTLIVTLGMRAVVTRTGITDKDGNQIGTDSFKFENGPYTIGMAARIFDDRGNAITEQENVVLYYWLDGGQTDQDGMYTTLRWDAADQRYEGHLSMANAGTYYCDRLTVTIDGSPNNIRNAPDAPVFESTPPEPPRMDLTRNTTNDYQFAPSGDAQMSVNMYYAQSANIYALIRNVQTGDEVLMPSTGKKMITNPADPSDTNYYSFFFNVPLTPRGNEYNGSVYQEVQDGEWVIEEVWLQKVFDKDTNYYPPTVDESTGLPIAENCMVFDVYDESKTAQENIYTYVVQTIRPVYSYTQSAADGTGSANYDASSKKVILGKDASGKVDGDFMDTYNCAITVTIQDWNGAAIRNLTDTVMTIQHQAQNQAAMGGYSGGTYGTNTITMSGSGAVFTTNNRTFQLAGTYTTEFSFKVTTQVEDPDTGELKPSVFNYDTKNYPSSSPAEYELWSVKPYLKISSITPTNTNPTGLTVSRDWKGTPTFGTTANQTSSKTDYAATLYALAVVDNSSIRHHGTFTQPTITIEVIGNATGYSVSFTLPGGSANDIVFTGEGNAKITKTLGRKTSANAGTGIAQYTGHTIETYFGHGSVEITTLTITKNGVNYTVTLDNPLLINNPSSP